MKKVSILLVTYFVSFTMVFAQNDFKVIAEVNLTRREPITVGTLRKYVNNFEAQARRPLTVDERRQILDSLIDNRLVLQLARKEGVKIADSQVDEYFQAMLSQMVGQHISESQFEAEIKAQGFSSFDSFMKEQNGMTVSEYKEFLRDQLTSQAYIFKKHGNDIQKVDATNAEVEKYYDVNKQHITRPDMITAFFVAVEKKGKTSKEKSKIDSLRTRVSANPRSTSQILEEAQKEGSGFIAMDLYISKTEQAAMSLGITMSELLQLFNLSVNKVTEVKEMPNNFQFFVIKAKDKMKFLKLDDKMDPAQDITVRQYLQMTIRNMKQQQAMAEAITEVVKSVKNSKTFKISQKDSELNKLLAW